MSLRTIFCLGAVLGALFGPASGRAATPAATATQSAAASSPHCLPQRSADLVQLVQSQPLALRRAGGQMVPVTRGSPRWMAGFNAVLAWQNDDCSAFATFVELMGYEAIEVLDTVTRTRHWLVAERGVDRALRYSGLFVLRAPEELARARRLVINAPHVGFDFTDDRAVRLYRELGASVFVQNTAHRCNLDACSGCGSFVGYACGGCARVSDSAHSVDNLQFAVFAALEATRTHDSARPWLHFEYHGMAARPPQPGCTGVAQVSQGSLSPLPAAVDEGTYPNRFWRALEARIGDPCVCYHQRERGCLLPGSFSVFGRLVNQESSGPFDPCTQEATRLSGRYVHFEWHQVAVEDVAAALAAAVPLPSTIK